MRLETCNELVGDIERDVSRLHCYTFSSHWIQEVIVVCVRECAFDRQGYRFF